MRTYSHRSNEISTHCAYPYNAYIIYILYTHPYMRTQLTPP